MGSNNNIVCLEIVFSSVYNHFNIVLHLWIFLKKKNRNKTLSFYKLVKKKIKKKKGCVRGTTKFKPFPNPCACHSPRAWAGTRGGWPRSSSAAACTWARAGWGARWTVVCCSWTSWWRRWVRGAGRRPRVDPLWKVLIVEPGSALKKTSRVTRVHEEKKTVEEERRVKSTVREQVHSVWWRRRTEPTGFKRQSGDWSQRVGRAHGAESQSEERTGRRTRPQQRRGRNMS